MIGTQSAAAHHSAPLATECRQAKGFVRRAWRAYWDWRAKRMTVHILRSLDDRTLKDIGVGSSEICSVVYGRANERRHRYHADWRSYGGA